MRASFSEGSRLRRFLIIGLGLALACALGACSALRFVYNQGPQWAYWWLDNYVDFQDDQEPRVEAALQQWFAWHRRTQLADYAALLERARTEVLQEATTAQVCGWWDTALKRRDEALEAALPAITTLAPLLRPEQLTHLERELAKKQRELRDDYLQDDLKDRQKQAAKRTVERIETLYGRLDGTQRAFVARMVGASPWKPERWLAEREQYARDTVATLRALATPGLDPGKAQDLARTWATQGQQATPGDEATRRYYEEVKAYNCRVAAELHNLTTPDQRKTALSKLQGWRQDLMSLAGLL